MAHQITGSLALEQIGCEDIFSFAKEKVKFKKNEISDRNQTEITETMHAIFLISMLDRKYFDGNCQPK